MATYLQITKHRIRLAKAKGHDPVSQGCGFFRCKACNLSAYLDTDADSRWFELCPKTIAPDAP